MVRCCAAINRRLAQSAGRTIGHKEYAGRAQGKWDPGVIDMGLLRRDIEDQIGRIPHPSPTPRPPVPVGEYAHVLLFRGSQGPQVAVLQARLNDEPDAETLVVDGIFGPKTEAVVRAFQRRTRGLRVDGIVGPATAARTQAEVRAAGGCKLCDDTLSGPP